MNFRGARERDLFVVQELLVLCGLPIDDCADHIDGYILAEAEEDIVAVGGLEIHGDDGLIRSIAVAPHARRRGLGTAVCLELHKRAAEAGVKKLVLLTETAGPFFGRLGFISVDRSESPATIQATRQFSEICPSSAQVMLLEIEPAPGKGAP